MKYKIKELDTDTTLFTFDKVQFQNNSIINHIDLQDNSDINSESNTEINIESKKNV